MLGEMSNSFRNMKVSHGFYDAIVLPHCKIRLCTCIMYYLDAFLHDLMSQISQMSFYCEPWWMKCDELLRGCRHDINMSLMKNLVAIDQLVKNIIMEANFFFFFFKCVCFIYFVYFIICGIFRWCYCVRISYLGIKSLFIIVGLAFQIMFTALQQNRLLFHPHQMWMNLCCVYCAWWHS